MGVRRSIQDSIMTGYKKIIRLLEFLRLPTKRNFRMMFLNVKIGRLLTSKIIFKRLQESGDIFSPAFKTGIILSVKSHHGLRNTLSCKEDAICDHYPDM